MKFRISNKDFIYFIAFTLLLLYLCSIATSNIYSFGATGTFHGLSPFLGLTKFFWPTMLLFILALILIFSSVSSYVFERKKGIGFEINEKESKGYSRWAKEKEMKGDKGVQVVDPLQHDSEYAGIPLVNDGKKLWVDNGEYHNLVIGATGSGKSQTIVEPMVELLIKKGESMIITDPKGELYRAASNYLRERGYNVVVLNFREPQNGNAWNPLTLPYQYYKDGNIDKATELLDDVALNILYDPNNKGEPFWEKSAADYFSGLTLGLFEDAKPEEINLNSINYMSTVGEDKFASGTYIKEYFTLKGESSNAYVFASNTINAPGETKGGILSVFRQKIRLFASRENLSEMLSYSDFDMKSIGKQKTAVFIVIHDEKTTYHSLATIFIKQCYETLIDVAQANGGKLPYRTNFILDEFANMPPLKDVTTMVTAARSRDIRFTFIIQNFAQLKSVYGNENAETIKGNCGNLVYLISTELAALEEISKMCGEVKSSDKDKTASTPLVTVTDLQKLKLFEAIIIRWRLSPFKTKYTPNFKMDWGHAHIDATYPNREVKEIKLFDVKTFVKEKKRQNMMDNFGDSSKSSPFAPSSSSPFGGSSSPFGGSSSPFGGSSSSSDSSTFGGFGSGGLDLDAMMKDIDRKIAELDAEEAKQKAELEKKKQEEKDKASKLEDSIEDKLNKLDQKIDDVEDKVDDKFLDIDKKIDDRKDSFYNTLPSIEFDDFENDDFGKKEDKAEIKKDSYNIFDTSFDNGEISIDNKKANFAVATGSPVDEFEMDDLPKVENADMLKPTYNNTIKNADDYVGYNDYNIFADIPDLKEEKKEERVEEKKKETVSVPKIDSSYYEKMSTKYEDDSKPVVKEAKVEKTNVNIDPDKVLIDSNVISDDEFFDDFFGDD